MDQTIRFLHAANTLERVVEQVEQATSLDPAADRSHDAVARAIPNGPAEGRPERHLARPPAAPDAHRPADRLLDLGVRARHRRRQAVAAGRRAPRRSRCARARCRPRPAAPPTGPTPTAASRRVGLVHAAANTSPIAAVRVVVERSPPEPTCARRRPRLPRCDRGNESAASSADTCWPVEASAWTTPLFHAGPVHWTPTVEEATRVDRCTPGRRRRRARAPPPSRRSILAVGATCPHRGAPLEEGSFDAETVTCPVARQLLLARRRRAAARSVGDAAAALRDACEQRHRRGASVLRANAIGRLVHGTTERCDETPVISSTLRTCAGGESRTISPSSPRRLRAATSTPIPEESRKAERATVEHDALGDPRFDQICSSMSRSCGAVAMSISPRTVITSLGVADVHSNSRSATALHLRRRSRHTEDASSSGLHNTTIVASSCIRPGSKQLCLVETALDDRGRLVAP